MIEIRVDEGFPHLNRAPIVEAVLDIRARAIVPFEESSVRTQLTAILNGYDFLDSQRELQFESRFAPGEIVQNAPVVTDLGWKGVRFRSADQKQIISFQRDGLGFSRLEPYTDWHQFSTEGLRLWQIFKQAAAPLAIHRLGLRYINRIRLPVSEVLISDYIDPAPASPRQFELPFAGFLHHDVLSVPGHPYGVNIVRTVQPATEGTGIGLILDIEVYTLSETQIEEVNLMSSFAEMRWLKNKVFFGSVTERTQRLCT